MDHQGRPALRILVVDDHEPYRRYFCSTLEQRADFQVVGQASDGLEAVQKAEELQPDLILLDVGLPKLNGLEAAREVRKLAPLAKILFISQEFSFDVVEAALRLGAVGYVHKLRVHRDLMPAIESILRGKYFVSGVVRGGFGEAAIDKPAIRHEVQFCSDDAACVRCFTDFTASTMKAGKAAIVIATESHRAGVLEGLSANNWDVNSAIQQGVLVPLDVTERLSTLMLNETLDPARFFNIAGGVIEEAAKAAQREQAPRVSVCRECPPALFATGRVDQALRLEQLWGLIAHTSVLDLLCGYTSGIFEKHKNIFESISAEHSAIHSR
ncbi:MAG TPA: response regulator transcription factor [Terriglobales bacterium]|nr:response regulator transcription factor [Terriglobales bacterium]